MPLYTAVAIRERMAAATTELRSLSNAIEGQTGEARTAAVASYDAADATLRGMQEDLARAERIEGLAPDQRGDGGGGDGNTQDLTGEHRDSPLLNPDANGYSILRAMNIRANGGVVDGVEGEIHTELAKRATDAGVEVQGFMAPHTMQVDSRSIGLARENRAADLTDTTDGAGGIPTVQGGTFIDVLRRRSIMRRMGAIILANMVGSFSIPKKTAVNTFEWVAEGAAPAGSKMVIGSVGFAERTIAGLTRLTRSFLRQTSLDAEGMARMDLVDGLALAIDAGGLAGQAGGNSPVGLLELAGIATVENGTNGDAMTHAKWVEMETAVFANDADVDTMGYAVNAGTRGSAKTTQKFAGTGGQTIWEPGNTINGYRAETSNQLPSDLTKGSSNDCSAAVFGNFADAVYALWGGVDLLVNPFSEDAEGNIRLTIHQSADFNCRRTESFSRTLDIKN